MPEAASPKPRHHGSEKRQRTAGVRVRLTPEERRQVEEAATRAGLTLASFTRQQMLGGPLPRAARRPVVEKVLLGQILAELGKIGSNLNQTAKAANIGSFSVVDHQILMEAIAALDTARAALLQALGRGP